MRDRMGSLKDETRGLREDHQPCEKTDGGVSTGGSDITDQLNTGHESATQGDFPPNAHVNAGATEERDKNPTSKDQVLSGGDGGNADQSDSKQDKDCMLADGGDEIITALNATGAAELPRDAGEGADLQKDENMSHTRESNADPDNVLVPVPSTPDPSDPRSPAPVGQQHMRTQVSLEVVQCCSVATSPMTPPEGGHSFFFPSSFGKFATVEGVTKDAELQVGQKVEFCSVATSPMPMTPKIPTATAFPELIGTETALKDEKDRKAEEKQESVKQDSTASTKKEAESEITGDLKFSTSKELSEVCSSNVSPDTTNSTASGLTGSQGTVGDNNQQCKQPRMGSMDQDITILVTHYVNDEEGEEDKEESSLYFKEPDMAKLDESEEEGQICTDGKKQDGEETISTETNDGEQDTSSTSHQENKTEESSDPEDQQSTTCGDADDSETKENKSEEQSEVTKPLVPESPAPFGCHNIRTQVSLEVVQCQSAATSPMTPPEGDQAFCFPSSLGKCTSVGTETKDAEMQVGQRVEFRSVATAPMTPRTPTTMTFPEVRKEKSIEEKIVEEEEEEEEAEEQDEEKRDEVTEEQEKIAEEEKLEAAGEGEEEETASGQEKGEEKCEEPVQEVSWDEKGMTWEVYGAVVEVAVLGSAIQKHLEKQVKKQKMQASLPPPPPLNPSATPLAAEPTPRGAGSGKGRAGKRAEKEGKVGRRRRNPFRQLMENMQQPHCCSRAHTTE